ncbi:hypothetical protein HNR75_001063 [Tolumonas osonensis]|uniref:Uncharacterized protein n=1 Tax=Tolumonas osonensis TaxID=675874 RepID=A0A841GJ02_9GAMM|nr:hypothetical protein [Tolumonas osonensis]
MILCSVFNWSDWHKKRVRQEMSPVVYTLIRLIHFRLKIALISLNVTGLYGKISTTLLLR